MNSCTHFVWFSIKRKYSTVFGVFFFAFPFVCRRTSSLLAVWQRTDCCSSIKSKKELCGEIRFCSCLFLYVWRYYFWKNCRFAGVNSAQLLFTLVRWFRVNLKLYRLAVIYIQQMYKIYEESHAPRHRCWWWFFF